MNCRCESNGNFRVRTRALGVVWLVILFSVAGRATATSVVATCRRWAIAHAAPLICGKRSLTLHFGNKHVRREQFCRSPLDSCPKASRNILLQRGACGVRSPLDALDVAVP